MPSDALPDLGVELRGLKHQLTLMNVLAYYRTLDPNSFAGRELHGVIEVLVGKYITETAKETDL